MLEKAIEFSGMHFSLNTGFILLALVALETVLSADNAVALAAFVQPLQDPKQQQQALNWGLAAALFLRIALLLMFTMIGILFVWGFSRRSDAQLSVYSSATVVEPVVNPFD